MPDTAELSMLGHFELRIDGRVWELSDRCETLLAMVALEEHPVARSRLAGRLWPDKCEERATANLRSAVWRLNKLPVRVLRCTGRLVALQDHVRVDVSDLRAWADRIIDGAPSRHDIGLVLTPDLFNLLPDTDGEWLVVERERLRQRILHAADRLVDLLSQVGAFARALDVGLSALAQEPLRESTNLAVIGVHLAEGNRTEALRHLDLCCARLESEFGNEPSTELRRAARHVFAE